MSEHDPERFFALFDDLEQQAESLYAEERDLELADRTRAEYSAVTLASRLMASLGTVVDLECEGVGTVGGRLERVGAEWCLVNTDRADPLLRRVWIVRLAATVAVSGVSERSVPDLAWSPLARLGLGSALRRLSEEGLSCRVHRRDGSTREGRIGRVGEDFLELVEERAAQSAVRLLPFSAVSAIASRPDSDSSAALSGK